MAQNQHHLLFVPHLLYRHLAVLEAAGLLMTVPTANSGGTHLYALSPAGARWYVTHQSTANAPVLVQPDVLLRCLPRLPVWLPLQTFLQRSLIHLSNALTHQGRHPTLIRWNWQRDYQHAFAFREQGWTMRADAAWTFGIRGWQGAEQDNPAWFACFLLFQPLTEARLMTARLDRLLRWRESAERWAHYQAMPPVLIVATSQRQAEWWQRCAEKAADRLRVDPLGGAVTCQEELAVLPSPWQVHWQRLVSQEQVHLRDLFTPLPLEAFPQDLRPMLPDPLPATVPLDRTHAFSLANAPQRRTRGPRAAWEAPTLAEVPEGRPQSAWLSCHLSARHWHLLLLLFAHPLLSREELAVFLGLRVSSARLLLRPVTEWGCITAQETKTGPRWHLTGLGLRLLAAAHQVDVRNLAAPPASRSDIEPEHVQRGLPWFQQHVRHTAGLYGFFARLTQDATSDQELCWWETGAACERRYQRQEHWHNFRPDALAEYRVGEHTFRFWLEWDGGTMNVRDLRTKFASYVYYLASREWVKERTPLPLVLCAAPEVGQEQRIAHLAQMLMGKTHGLTLYTTTRHLLETLGPLASIWVQVIPLAQSTTESSPRQSIFT